MDSTHKNICVNGRPKLPPHDPCAATSLIIDSASRCAYSKRWPTPERSEPAAGAALTRREAKHAANSGAGARCCGVRPTSSPGAAEALDPLCGVAEAVRGTVHRQRRHGVLGWLELLTQSNHPPNDRPRHLHGTANNRSTPTAVQPTTGGLACNHPRAMVQSDNDLKMEHSCPVRLTSSSGLPGPPTTTPVRYTGSMYLRSRDGEKTGNEKRGKSVAG